MVSLDDHFGTKVMKIKGDVSIKSVLSIHWRLSGAPFPFRTAELSSA